jgi:hypothetical protein
MAISYVANETDAGTTSLSLTVGNSYKAGDIFILEYTHLGTATGTIGGTYSGGPWTQKTTATYNGGAYSSFLYWSRTTGTHASETITVTGLTNSCAGGFSGYRGALASGDPLSAATLVTEENSSGNETQAGITTTVDNAMVVLAVFNGNPEDNVTIFRATDPSDLDEKTEVLSSYGLGSSMSHAAALKSSAGATGSFTWSQNNAISRSWAYAIHPEISNGFLAFFV